MSVFSKFKLINVSFAAILISLATAFKFAIILNGINLVLVCISIFLVIFYWKILLHKLPKQLGLYLLPFTLLIPLFTNYDTFRSSSFLYSLMFIGVFKIGVSFLYKGYIPLKNYKRILKFILKSYFIVGLVQSILFPLGVFFNRIWQEDSYRVNSLATEPSYAGIIVVVTLYSLLLIDKFDKQEKYSLKSNLVYFGYVLFVVLFSQSGFALIFFVILLISVFKIKKHTVSLLFLFIVVGLIIYFNVNSSVAVRVEKLLIATGSLDVNQLVDADHSGSIRIAPVIIFFKELNLLDLNYWVGHGIGYTKEIMVNIIPGVDEDLWGGAAFIPSYVLDNGIISMVIFFSFIKKNVLRKVLSFEFLFLVLTLINSSFNSQLFWFIIMMLTTNKFIITRYRQLNKIILKEEY